MKRIEISHPQPPPLPLEYEERFAVEFDYCGEDDYRGQDLDNYRVTLYFYFGHAGHRHKNPVGENMEVWDLSPAEIERIQERARRHIFTEMIPLPA